METSNKNNNDTVNAQHTGMGDNAEMGTASYKAVSYQLDASPPAEMPNIDNDESSINEMSTGQYYSPGQSPPDENNKGILHDVLNNSEAMRGEIDPQWRKKTGRNNSYTGGNIKKGSSLNTPQKYNGTIEASAAKGEFDLFLKAINASMSLLMNVLEVQPITDGILEKFEKEAKEKYEAAKQLIRYEIGHFESQVEYLEDKPASTKLLYYKNRLKKSEADLKKLEDGEDSFYEVVGKMALNISSQVIAYGSSLITISASYSQVVNNTSPTAMVEVTDKASKIEQVISVGTSLLAMCDTSAMDNFTRNPNFETAQAWGAKVGQLFSKLSGIASGLPMGWGTVLSGTLNTPQVVISKFSNLVQSRYEKIDQLTKTAPYTGIMPGGTYTK